MWDSLLRDLHINNIGNLDNTLILKLDSTTNGHSRALILLG